jgi:hypothetical protein
MTYTDKYYFLKNQENTPVQKLVTKYEMVETYKKEVDKNKFPTIKEWLISVLKNKEYEIITQEELIIQDEMYTLEGCGMSEKDFI